MAEPVLNMLRAHGRLYPKLPKTSVGENETRLVQLARGSVKNRLGEFRIVRFRLEHR